MRQIQLGYDKIVVVSDYLFKSRQTVTHCAYPMTCFSKARGNSRAIIRVFVNQQYLPRTHDLFTAILGFSIPLCNSAKPSSHLKRPGKDHPALIIADHDSNWFSFGGVAS
jgi:hypothetical protein